MSKLRSNELLENGNGKYMAQVALTYIDVKTLFSLVETELMAQRKHGKAVNYQQVRLLKRTLCESSQLLKTGYQARQEGRYQASNKPPTKIDTNKEKLK